MQRLKLEFYGGSFEGEHQIRYVPSKNAWTLIRAAVEYWIAFFGFRRSVASLINVAAAILAALFLLALKARRGLVQKLTTDRPQSKSSR